MFSRQESLQVNANFEFGEFNIFCTLTDKTNFPDTEN